MRYIFNAYVVSTQNEADLLKSDNPLAIAVLANLYVVQTRNTLEKRAEYKKKLFELAKLKGYDAEKTKRLLTFVLHLMQLPKELNAEIKSFFNQNKKTSTMSATTQIYSKNRNKMTKQEREDDDFLYEFVYGKTYDELYADLIQKAKEQKMQAAEDLKIMVAAQAKILTVEYAKVLAAEQAKLLAAEQAKLLAVEQSVTTMFQKTGWTADKIADISGFPIELVQQVVDKLKG